MDLSIHDDANIHLPRTRMEMIVWAAACVSFTWTWTFDRSDDGEGMGFEKRSKK